MLKNNLSHVAFILDGNKRWAKKNNLSTSIGYEKGFERIKDIVNFSHKINLQNITLFTLSSENLNRPSVKLIYEIIYTNFTSLINQFSKKKNININIFGSKKNLPIKLINIFKEAEKFNNKENKLNLNIAFNYGFKEEVLEVIKKYKNSNIDTLEENYIRKLFYLGSIPDPELLIRTGGYKRLSNFIMYNLTYTELFFTNTLWPDFSLDEYSEIIKNFNKIDRNYGL